MIERVVVYSILFVLGSTAGVLLDLGLAAIIAVDLVAVVGYESIRLKAFTAAALSLPKLVITAATAVAAPVVIRPASVPAAILACTLIVMTAVGTAVFVVRHRRHLRYWGHRHDRRTYVVTLLAVVAGLVCVGTAGMVMSVPPVTYPHLAASAVALALWAAILAVRPGPKAEVVYHARVPRQMRRAATPGPTVRSPQIRDQIGAPA